MSLLVIAHDACSAHQAGRSHPERPERLDAVQAGIELADVGDAVSRLEAPLAPLEALAGVHTADLVDTIQSVCASGGGRIDADTVAVEASFDAARRAAGAGLLAIDELAAGRADVALCAVRPPGHHATRAQSMGFCLFNSVAVTARHLADLGERVLIVDYDAHHGNGTQDIFYEDPRVLFVSFHQWPCYPGTGALDERGSGAGFGTTINLPLPPGATGDVYLQAWDRVVAPRVDAFAPTWLLISAGFDAHRADPITQMGLTAGDYPVLTRRLRQVVPTRRTAMFLEGGYDLHALRLSSAAVVADLCDQRIETEAASNGGPGQELIGQAAAMLLSEGRPK